MDCYDHKFIMNGLLRSQIYHEWIVTTYSDSNHYSWHSTLNFTVYLVTKQLITAVHIETLVDDDGPTETDNLYFSF